MPRTAQVRPAALAALKPGLDDLYAGFNLAHFTRDPIWTVRRFADPADQEIAAFLASALASGRVQSVIQTVDAVLGVMGTWPAAFVRAFTPDRASAFDTLGHRWIRSRDLAALAWQLHQMLCGHGSLEKFFPAGHAADADSVEAGLESFSSRAMVLDLRAIYGRARPVPARESATDASWRFPTIRWPRRLRRPTSQRMKQVLGLPLELSRPAGGGARQHCR